MTDGTTIFDPPPSAPGESNKAPAPRPGLTRTQRRLLDFVAGFIAKRGYSPSYTEMKDGIGFRSTGAIATLVAGLEQRGYILRLRGRHRSIALTDAPSPLSHKTLEAT
jgi:SOS-response transcriptional repressor LexA